MIYLALGANLGDRRANMERAIVLLNERGVNVLRRSSIYETEPRDVVDQPWFLNMVLECETRLFPLQLLRAIHRIEKQLGRDRSIMAVRRGPRLIDIDILLYHNAVIQTERLIVPHPRMLERRFVLEPLLELVPELKQVPSQALLAVRSQKITKLV